MDTTERVIVVGLGYVGLPLALRAVQAGFDVIGVDLSTERIARLRDANSFVEDITDGEIKEALNSGRFAVTTELADAGWFDVAVIAVPTPLRDGSPDLSFVTAAGAGLGTLVRPGACVVLESTTYPGTTEEMVVPLLEEASGLVAGGDFHLGFSPERIDPGNPTWTSVNTPKIVSGHRRRLARARSRRSTTASSNDGCRCSARGRPSWPSSSRTRSATSTSRSSTSSRCSPTTSASTCGRRSTRRPPSRSGSCGSRPGRGSAGTACRSTRPTCPGGCSGRWARASASSSWPTTSTTTCPTTWCAGIVMALNERQQSVNGARILLLGLAYKKNTGDARESPAVRVAQLLGDLGADVRVADPHVVEARWTCRAAGRADRRGARGGRRGRAAHRPRRVRLDRIAAHASYVFDMPPPPDRRARRDL